MNFHGRLSVFLLAALLLVAQHGAASHAITHFGDPSGGTLQVSDHVAHHDCADCARFDGGSVGVPAAQEASLATPDTRAVLVSRNELRPSMGARGPPRNRGPPLA